MTLNPRLPSQPKMLSSWPDGLVHSRILSRIQRAAQTVLGIYWKRTCSRVTSASSALWVLNDYSEIPLHGPDTDRTRTKSAHVVEYELNSTTWTRTRTRHGPDTDRTRTKSAHVVGYELNSTTRTRPDPHGPNGVSPQKKVRAGPVGSVSGPCSGI